MNFDRWYRLGLKKGWIAEGVCSTHDMMPLTEAEAEEFEGGGDPCIPVLRVWLDKT